MSGTSRKQREFVRREQDILDTALRLFDQENWQAVSIETIANTLGIAKGTIYNHFDSKDEIYARLALTFFQMENAKLQHLRHRNADPVAQVKDILRIFWERVDAPPQMQRLVQYVWRKDFLERLRPETHALLQETDHVVNQTIAAIAAEGVKAGMFLDKPLPLLLFPAQATLAGALQLAFNGYIPDNDKNAALEALTDAVLAGLTCSQTTTD
ncbi:TetR/AcrR family transcriptional regulator [Agrobacterium sp. SOY23]|uniref:TetR/AcrR family transcriptional regulator n=1 Tax=Agrobacterium sp. SOY23 TaxID=3014555 RepID=UPI0022AE8983|nr:TetR/AcrR family transcriptional regulator [Agrobacterium sp. SOY23]MCZ4429885.1 TetR/AcrR family transcriptional regulator [Agrobacterium sp. SOY23]